MLTLAFSKEQMGGGIVDYFDPPEKHRGWKYPPPGSSLERSLEVVCRK